MGNLSPLPTNLVFWIMYAYLITIYRYVILFKSKMNIALNLFHLLYSSTSTMECQEISTMQSLEISMKQMMKQMKQI